MYAVIDIGSNSARSLWRLTEDDIGTQSIAYTRLADDLDATGRLGQEGLARTQHAIDRLLQEMPEMALESCRLFATSAFREATNGQAALADLSRSIGMPITLLSEEEEAYYGYKGASSSFGQEALSVLDIGGGSTELSWDTGGFQSRSVPLGSLRLLHQDLDPDALGEKLAPLLEGFPTQAPPLMVAIGGTVTTLAAMHHALGAYDSRKIHGTVLDVAEIRTMVARLAEMTLEERQHVPGLPPARADIILPGASILLALCARISCESVTVSTEDILHGLIGLDLSDVSS